MQGDSKHLLLAHLFDKPCFLGLLAVQVTHMNICFYDIIQCDRHCLKLFWLEFQEVAAVLQINFKTAFINYNS